MLVWVNVAKGDGDFSEQFISNLSYFFLWSRAGPKKKEGPQ